MKGSVSWGTDSYTSDPNNLLWALYDGANGLGLSITSGTMNLVATHNENRIVHRVGGVEVAQTNKVGLSILNDKALILHGQDSDARYWLRTEDIAGTPGPAGETDRWTALLSERW